MTGLHVTGGDRDGGGDSVRSLQALLASIINSMSAPMASRAAAPCISSSLCGPRAGTALALPLVAWLISTWNWEASVIVTGLLSIVWVVLRLVFCREAEDYKGLDPQAVKNLVDARRVPQAKVPWLSLPLSDDLGRDAGLFLSDLRQLLLHYLVPDLPDHHSRGSLKDLGTFGAIPALMGIPGSVLGCVVSDWLFRKGFRLTIARKSCLVGGMLCSSLIALPTSPA